MLSVRTFTQAQAAEVLRLYKEILGGQGTRLTAQKLHNQITGEAMVSYYDCRMGSRWTPESKLFLKVQDNGNVVFGFNPSLDPTVANADPAQLAACQAGQRFAEAVNQIV